MATLTRQLLSNVWALAGVLLLGVVATLIVCLPSLLPDAPYAGRDALLRGEPDPSIPYYGYILVAQIILLLGLLWGSLRWLSRPTGFFLGLLLLAMGMLLIAGCACLVQGCFLMFFRIGPNPEGLFG